MIGEISPTESNELIHSFKLMIVFWSMAMPSAFFAVLSMGMKSFYLRFVSMFMFGISCLGAVSSAIALIWLM